jgi:hypothetical protein
VKKLDAESREVTWKGSDIVNVLTLHNSAVGGSLHIKYSNERG